MEAVSGGMNASGGSKSAEADGNAHAADGDDGSAGALQDGEDAGRPIEDLGVDEQRY